MPVWAWVALMFLVWCPLAAWGVQYLPDASRVSVRGRHRHAFRCVRPSALNAWFRRRWMPPSALSGDAFFDAEWSLDTRDRELGAALLGRRDVRELLRSLGELRCTVVAQTGRGLHAHLASSAGRGTWPAGRSSPLAGARSPPDGTGSPHDITVKPRDRARKARAELRERVLAPLQELDALIEPLRRPSRHPHRWPSWRVLALALSGVLSAAAFTVWLVSRTAFPMLESQVSAQPIFACAGLPVALLSVPVVGRFLRGHAGAHEEIIAPVVLVAMCCVLAFMVAGTELNARLDPGPATTTTVRVVARHESRGRNDPTVGLRVWMPGRDDTLDLLTPTGSAAAERAPGDWIELTTSPGWLGVEWLRSVRPVPHPARR